MYSSTVPKLHKLAFKNIHLENKNIKRSVINFNSTANFLSHLFLFGLLP